MEIPDSIDPYVGYRLWKKVGDKYFGRYEIWREECRLSKRSGIWGKLQVGQEVHATCQITLHPAPDDRCRCGIYVVPDAEYLVSDLYDLSPFYIAKVQLYGKVIVCERGARGEWCEILEEPQPAKSFCEERGIRLPLWQSYILPSNAVVSGNTFITGSTTSITIKYT